MRASVLVLLLLSFVPVLATEHRGAQFVGFTQFTTFSRELSERALVLVSPRIETEIEWDELVVSWNFRSGAQDAIELESKAIYPARETQWYPMGKWALDPVRFPRESVRGQKDSDGTVDTDILRLSQHVRFAQLRVTIRGTNSLSALKFLGLSFYDRRFKPEAIASTKSAWGTSLMVPERSQTAFPEGINEWCSPTAVSMLLGFWATNLSRRDLQYEVPEVARKVNDPNWPGTGNWPFNMAFAGAHPGIRAYVTRLSDIVELEEWVKGGVPVAISVRNGWLKGREESGNGHLVVCNGFNENGDVIFNDPGRSQVRQTYRRKDVIKAWAASRHTVYLVYPEDFRVPQDRFGHWYTVQES